jgi:hypothetical protein
LVVQPIRDVAKSGAHSGAATAIKPFLDMYHHNRTNDRAERKEVKEKLAAVETALQSTQSNMVLIMRHLGISAEGKADDEEDAPDPYSGVWPDSSDSSSDESEESDEEMPEVAPMSAVKRKKPEEQPAPVVLRIPKDMSKKRKPATPKVTPAKGESKGKVKGKGATQPAAAEDDAAMAMLRSIVVSMKGNVPAITGFRASMISDTGSDVLLNKLLNELH